MSRVWNFISSLFHKSPAISQDTGSPSEKEEPKRDLPKMSKVRSSDMARKEVIKSFESDPDWPHWDRKEPVGVRTSIPGETGGKILADPPEPPFITFENYATESIKLTHLIEPILRSYGYPETRGIHTFMPASGARFLMDERINSILMLRGNIYDYFQMAREEMDCVGGLGYAHYSAEFDQKMFVILSDIDRMLREQYPRYIGYRTIVGRGKPGSYYYVAVFW